MRRILLGVLALGTTTLVAPAAHAASPDIVHGGCTYNYAGNATSLSTPPPGELYGYIGDLSATTTSSGTPIAATVTCWIDVNGVEAPGTRFGYAGTGVQAGVNPITFTARNTDQIDICNSVLFGDNTTTDATCFAIDSIEIPPQVVWDALGTAFVVADEVEGCNASHDQCSAICAALPLFAGTYGPLTIGPDGDVDVTDPLGLGISRIYDCPPY
jgi:hypothetical protein